MLCAFLSQATIAKPITLQNDRLQLVFAVEGPSVQLAGLKANDGKRQWIAVKAGGNSLCGITLQRLEGKYVRRKYVDTAQAAKVDCQQVKTSDGNALRLVWTDLKPAGLEGTVDVEATVTLKRGSPLAAWGLRVRDHLPGWGIEAVEFPRMRLTADREAQLASPHGLGRIYRNPTQFESETLGGAKFGPEMGGLYPFSTFTMQLMTLTQGSESLYLSTHDPQARGKFFHFAPTADKSSLECSVAHYPERPFESPYDWTCSYPTLTGLVSGDWWHCCRVYRRWALAKAEWTRPPVGRSPDKLPDWWVKTPLWDHCYYGRDVNGERRSLPYILRTQELLGGLPTAVMYPMWNTKGFDVGYPDFFPARDWFLADSQEARKHNVRYCPYINGMNADVDSDYWRNGGSRNRMLLEWTMNEEPTKGLQFECPQSDWQKEVAGLAGRAARELKVDCLYFDVVGCTPAVACYSLNHGHPVGNRCDLPLGIRRMMTRAREQAAMTNPDLIFSTEDASECYGFEAPFVCNRTLSDMDCPMLMAVYADRLDPFGYNMTDAEYRNDPMSWRTKLAEEFIYGMKIGCMFPDKPESKPDILTLLKNLATARIAAAKYLSVGQMMHVPTLHGANPSINTLWGDYGRPDKAMTRPAVRASSWLASDGTAALVFVNVAETPATLRWSVSRSDLRLPGGSCLLRETYPAPRGKPVVVQGEMLVGTARVPGLNATVLSLQPNPPSRAF
ncbi:MAG: hypothetical protein HY318_16115 [Armatimonadetes bacterium]|nr:hypothetical protein [Armatimonadota bacterium]